MSNDPGVSAASEPVYGKPFHGWSCDCDECQSYDERGEPRPGEAPVVPTDLCPRCGGEWVHLHDEDRIDHTRSWWQCRDCDHLRAQARRK